MIYGPATFFESDTTGEKEAEEFFTNKETVDWQRFQLWSCRYEKND